MVSQEASAHGSIFFLLMVKWVGQIRHRTQSASVERVYKFEPLGSSSEVYGLVGLEQALASSTERSSKHVGLLPSL